jgi:hypothetical protein
MAPWSFESRFSIVWECGRAKIEWLRGPQMTGTVSTYITLSSLLRISFFVLLPLYVFHLLATATCALDRVCAQFVVIH